MVREGVETLFTLPGGHIVPLLDGCLDSGLRVIDLRHEGAAALAAEGWALATGRTGVAAVTAGPGFANSLIGLVDAGLGAVPLLLFGGRTALELTGRGAVMDIDQRAIAAPAAKWTATCLRPERIAGSVSEALHRASSGRPGAVYLEVPADVLGAAAAESPGLGGRPAVTAPPASPPEALDRALEMLGSASRPVAVAGSGAFWSGAGEALRAFCAAAGIPLTTTSAARGLVPDSDPWCLGSLIHGGIALATADVVLVLGSAFNGNLLYGGPPLFGADQRIIQVDIAPEQLGGNRKPELALVGDVGQVLTALLERGPVAPASREGWREEAAELAAASMAMWDAQIDRYEGDLVHPGALAREVARFAAEAAGPEATLVADGGDVLTWALAYFRAEAPGRHLGTTTALGTLGVGLPFALAARAARPQEPVILLTGDGSFGLSAMELDSLARQGLPAVVVVSNNAGWGDVRHHQRAVYGPGREVASRLAPCRYDRLAEALGGGGETVTRLDAVRPALERALASGVPYVVDVATEPEVVSDLLRSMGQMRIM